MFRQWIVGLTTFCLLACAAATASAAPDLLTTASLLARGVVSVRNTGDALAEPSIITIACHRPGRDIDRIEIPPRYRTAYTSTAFPSRIVVNVPRLAPGAVFMHTLPFWATMTWPPNTTFHFDVSADAGAIVAEGDAGEINNTDTYVKVVP